MTRSPATKTPHLASSSSAPSESGQALLDVRHWTVTRRVGVGFGIVMMIAGVVGGGSFDAYRRIERDTSLLGEVVLPEALAVLRLQQLVKDDFGLGQSLGDAATDTDILERIRRNEGEVDRLVRECTPRFAQGELAADFAACVRLRENWTAVLHELVRRHKEAPAQVAEWRRQQVMPVFTALDGALSSITKNRLARLDELNAQVRAQTSLGIRVLVGCIVGATIASLVVGLAVSRSLGRQLRELADALISGSHRVSDASVQVASAAQTLAEGASRQAAAIAETSATTARLTETAKKNADLAREARAGASRAREAAEAGTGAAGKLSTSMQELRASSREVAQIVKTIDEIAFQTNILALNAAVEAARAGEAGAGFAVVAEEVRGLAQRSAAAAKETSVKIEHALHSSEEGGRISEEVVACLGTLGERVKGLDEFVGEIARSSQQQHDGAGQINAAVVQLDEGIHANASSAQQAAAAASELDSQAETLKGHVGVMMHLVGGRRTGDAEGSTGDLQVGGRRLLDVDTREAEQVEVG